MLELLEKGNDGKYHYSGDRAEYTATCDEIGNTVLETKGHPELDGQFISNCHWLEGAEEQIRMIEKDKFILNKPHTKRKTR